MYEGTRAPDGGAPPASSVNECIAYREGCDVAEQQRFTHMMIQVAYQVVTSEALSRSSQAVCFLISYLLASSGLRGVLQIFVR